MTEQKVDFQIKSLQLYYQEKHILKSVDLSIYRNRVTALIGPSGCGKSTLLRCLNRMNDLIDGCKIEGTILYQNQDIQTIHPVDLRSKVGMVFQNPNPFPMSIFDNVAYGPRCSGIKNKAKLKEIVVDSPSKSGFIRGSKRPVERSGFRIIGRSAATSLHCPNDCHASGSYFNGRADQCAGSDCHAQNRRTDSGIEKRIYDRDCNAQYAASDQNIGLYGVLLIGRND